MAMKLGVPILYTARIEWGSGGPSRGKERERKWWDDEMGLNHRTSSEVGALAVVAQAFRA